MNTPTTIPPFAFLVKIALLGWILAMTTSVRATPIIWTGPNTNFDQLNAAADVLVPGAVSLSRAGNHWLYNTNVETGPAAGTPSDTEWAFGTIDNYASLTYQSFDSYRNGDLSGVLVPDPDNPPGPPMVVHLINEDIYLSLAFTRWPHGGGAFAYIRSTPGAVGPPTPSVNITTPTNNSVFFAPANVPITANASVTGGGSVTNVSFFFQGSATPIGSRQSAPFSVTASNLAVGPRSLFAVATAAGVSATSSIVNISVVSADTVFLTGARATNNQFLFSYNVNPGNSYVVESSSNLFVWKPLVTNVPGTSPQFFTNPISPGRTFFRVGRLP